MSGTTFKMLYHEGISSVAQLRQVKSVVSENLLRCCSSVCDKFWMSNVRRVLTLLNVSRSTNQVKEPVCREGVDSTSQQPHIRHSSSFSVLVLSVTDLSLLVVHIRVGP